MSTTIELPLGLRAAADVEDRLIRRAEARRLLGITAKIQHRLEQEDPSFPKVFKFGDAKSHGFVFLSHINRWLEKRGGELETGQRRAPAKKRGAKAAA